MEGLPAGHFPGHAQRPPGEVHWKRCRSVNTADGRVGWSEGAALWSALQHYWVSSRLHATEHARTKDTTTGSKELCCN